MSPSDSARHVVIRADASAAIGSGHVTRCLTLARALREGGAVVTFVCRELPGHLGDLILSSGFALALLGRQSTGRGTDDADETRAVIRALPVKPEWLVVDHYGLDQDWENSLADAVSHILAIDDLANRSHACDLLLDQNLVANMHARYDGVVPARCRRLLGPRFALLQSEYAELRETVTPRAGALRHLLIFFGGGPGIGLTRCALAAVQALHRRDVEVDVVVPSSAADDIRGTIGDAPTIRVHERLPSLAPLMARADLALGAAGATSWERLCLGLPSLVVIAADNQRPIADELHRLGLVRCLGDHETVNEAVIIGALNDVLSTGSDEEWSRRCLAAVDGRGTQRVRSAMTVTAGGAAHIRARPATRADSARLLSWANDPETRQNGFSPERIDHATHDAWLTRRLADADARLCIMETVDRDALGQVRLQRQPNQPETWEIHYAVAPELRGLGFGAPMLDAALAALRAEHPGALAFGRVKPENVASRRIFESLGFRERSANDAGTIEYERVA